MDLLQKIQKYNERRAATRFRAILTSPNQDDLEVSTLLTTSFFDLALMFCQTRGIDMKVDNWAAGWDVYHVANSRRPGDGYRIFCSTTGNLSLDDKYNKGYTLHLHKYWPEDEWLDFKNCKHEATFKLVFRDIDMREEMMVMKIMERRTLEITRKNIDAVNAATNGT